MGSTKNAERNYHAKRYIEAVFAARLREEGFFCPDDRLLCWYRVLNHEILQYLYFYTIHRDYPLQIQIGTGCHFLFTEPVWITDVYFPGRPLAAGLIQDYTIFERSRERVGSLGKDVYVDMPTTGGRGVYTFDEVILPHMQAIETPDQCYQMHRRALTNYEAPPGTLFQAPLSTAFIDEVINMHDAQVYPSCIERVEHDIIFCKNLLQTKPDKQEYQQYLQTAQMQKQALVEEKRDIYLQILEKQRKRTIKWLKKMGIPV